MKTKHRHKKNLKTKVKTKRKIKHALPLRQIRHVTQTWRLEEGWPMPQTMIVEEMDGFVAAATPEFLADMEAFAKATWDPNSHYGYHYTDIGSSVSFTYERTTKTIGERLSTSFEILDLVIGLQRVGPISLGDPPHYADYVCPITGTVVTNYSFVNA